MNINELLKETHCSCGKIHACKIKKIIIDENALSYIPETTSGYSHILLVADRNTYAVCGEDVKALLSSRTENILVYESDGFLVPDEQSVQQLKSCVTDTTDLIVGIGSGVIQDLCKYVSFLCELPYHIIATAPSMDGYASAGAAMIAGNMKVTYSTHVPEVIIGDINILKNAPMDMIKSGYGDILGKFSCLNDWKLSHTVNDEYLCDYVYSLTFEMLNKTKDLGEKLLQRDADAVKTLTEALIVVGIAMAYSGNSRPASGSEHHLSHFFEVIGIMKNEPYFLHGIDVAFSAVYTQRLREELLMLDMPSRGDVLSPEEYEEIIKTVYGDAAEGVISLQEKTGLYSDKIEIYKEKWQNIKAVLAETPSSAELINYLDSIGLDIKDFENTYDSKKLQNAIWFAKDLKDRYSVLWLYFSLMYRKDENL